MLQLYATEIDVHLFQDLVAYLAESYACIFLDSNQYTGHHHNLFAWEPLYTFQNNDLDDLDQFLETILPPSNLPESIFQGGVLGYIKYPKTAGKKPQTWFTLFRHTLFMDKSKKKCYCIHTDTVLTLPSIPKNTKNKVFQISNLKADWAPEKFIDSVKKIKRHIYEGDIYQANLSHRFTGYFTGSDWQLYKALLHHNPGPYGAFITHEDKAIYSSSPELFFKIKGRTIESRPIKGTCHRETDYKKDKQLQEALLCSEKDLAELLMITDLQRNDIGQICDYGTVRVPNLHRIESFPYLHHLVSTIKGRLLKNLSIKTILNTLFPGGSITGTPKKRAMEIIETLEPYERSIYTGSIGYITCKRNMVFNIAIRTIYREKNKLHFHAGAGIVADSDPHKEWLETLTKAKGLQAALYSQDTS